MSDPANQPPPHPRPAQKSNPRAAPDKERWQDKLSGAEGRHRLADLEAAKVLREQGKG
jgi:hypothetical protein